MNSNFVNPTYYNLQRAIIRSEYSPEFEVDVTNLIPSISITSSIDSETMYGSALVIDSVGLLDGEDGVRSPLRGEEQIILEIADSQTINNNGGNVDDAEDIFRFIGFIYKIDNVSTKEINDALVYHIHFVSYQSFKAGTYEIIRAFIDEKISDIVQKIFTENYQNNSVIRNIPESMRKSLFVEETSGTIRCWIPKMRSEEAMEFLSKRSYSVRSPSCLFRFFESTRGYHYVTDEQLFRLANDEAEEGYDSNRKFVFTYLDAIPNTLEYFKQQINNLEFIENTKRVNSIDDILNGVYRNKVYELDILSRNLNLLDDGEKSYDYFERRDKYQEIDTEYQRLVDRHTEAFIQDIHRRDSSDVQKSWLIIQNYTPTEESSEELALPAETYYAEIVSNRQAYSKHIESITVNAKGPGRLDITAGDIVELDIQEFKFADGRSDGDFEKNRHLSGNYIVRTVTHHMDKEEMFNTYVLIKRDWSSVENLDG